MKINAEKLRERLHKTLEEYGMTLMFVCKSLGWKYHNLNKFKNGHSNLSYEKQKVLNKFLDKYENDMIKNK